MDHATVRRMDVAAAHETGRPGAAQWLGQTGNRSWLSPLRSAIVAAVASACLAACGAPTDYRFSTSAADSLLKTLTNIHWHQVPLETDPFCTAAESDTRPIGEYVAHYLVTRLDFSCSALQWNATVERGSETWLTSGGALVAWKGARYWDDALTITLFYDEEPRGDSLSRNAVAYLAGFLEALRVFLTNDAPENLGVVVTISPTSDSPVTSHLSTTLVPSASNSRITTILNSLGDGMPRTPVAASNSPGWVIGTTSSRAMLSVLTSSEEDAPYRSPETAANIALDHDFQFYAEYRPQTAEDAIGSPQHHGQQLLGTLQTLPLSDPDRMLQGLPKAIMDFCENTYWGLGVILPLLFLAIAARVVTIESSAMVDYLQRGINALDAAEKRTSRRIRRLQDRRETHVRGNKGETSAENTSPRLSGPIEPWTRRFRHWRRERWKGRLKRNKRELKRIQERLLAFCTEWPRWKETKRRAAKRLGQLGSGAWDVALEEAGGQGGFMSLAGGALAVVVSFIVVHYSLIQRPIAGSLGLEPAAWVAPSRCWSFSVCLGFSQSAGFECSLWGRRSPVSLA